MVDWSIYNMERKEYLFEFIEESKLVSLRGPWKSMEKF